MKNNYFNTATQSGALRISWQPPYRKTNWPDIVDFFGKFGLKIFVGAVDYKKLLDHKRFHPNILDRTFNFLNEIVFDHQQFTPEDIHSQRIMPYFSKAIYHEDPTGQNWHTPMVFHYDSIKQKFDLTKGHKKLVALSLADVHVSPVIIVANQKEAPVDGLRKVKKDQDLLYFLQEVSGGICNDPIFGLEYAEYSNGLVPIIHTLHINDQVSARPDYERLYQADMAVWKKLKGKTICADIAGQDLIVPKYYRFVAPCELKCDLSVRENFTNSVSSMVICQRDTKIFTRLTNALVWLSSDPQGQPIGGWISRDRRYGVIFNNHSNRVLELPPGLLNI